MQEKHRSLLSINNVNIYNKLGMYTYKMTTHCLLSQACGEHPYRPAYLPNFATTTLTTSKCISNKATVYNIAKSWWKKKTAYFRSHSDEHQLLRTFCSSLRNYLHMISCLLENASRVMPEMRKRGVAPRRTYKWAYIYLD